jgi:adenylate cyclase
VLELMVLKRLAVNVLDTYVGRDAGARILNGDIRRGTGETLRAVLWYCDLRGFTPLADRLPLEDLIGLLNGYFEIMGGAVQARGGEILKFIGDAMLAIFPLPDGTDADARCRDALNAAEDAMRQMELRNRERRAWGQPILQAGIALHIGDVMYGNIGAPDRLDFTVIGPAVNLVTRIEGLCRELGRSVLTSAAVAGTCGDRLVPVGHHPVKGLREPVPVFALPLQVTASS